MNDDNVNTLLEKWFLAKQQINELESKINKYKKIAENIMDHRMSDEIKNDKFILQKKDINRTSISKNDLPPEIWNKYCKENFYSAFYISKINEKRKKSPKKIKKVNL
jgi:hypothetical protein